MFFKKTYFHLLIHTLIQKCPFKQKHLCRRLHPSFCLHEITDTDYKFTIDNINMINNLIAPIKHSSPLLSLSLVFYGISGVSPVVTQSQVPFNTIPPSRQWYNTNTHLVIMFSRAMFVVTCIAIANCFSLSIHQISTWYQLDFSLVFSARFTPDKSQTSVSYWLLLPEKRSSEVST